MAVRVWLNYNRLALLDFYDRHPERCLLLESYVVARRPSRLIEAIARKFGHHFGPIEDLYDKELYTHTTSRPNTRRHLACCFPEAIKVYHELLQQSRDHQFRAEFPFATRAILPFRRPPIGHCNLGLIIVLPRRN